MLGFRVSNHLAHNRSRSCTKSTCEEFFKLVQSLMDKLKLHQKPTHIFNVDETNFTSMASNARVFASKGSYRVNKLTGNNEKQNYTVQVCYNANGELLPLYVLYKYKNMYDSWTRNGPSNCHYNCTKNGWMEKPTFKDWFTTVFLEHVDRLSGKQLLLK